MVGSREGTYSHIDYYGDSIVNITLKEPIKLEVYMYTPGSKGSRDYA